MVERYPHTAVITKESGGGLVNGEWVEGTSDTVEITGRFDPVDTSDVVRLNSKGNEVIVKGEFYTKTKSIKGATTLEVVGVKREIICWWDYQSHSVISV